MSARAHIAPLTGIRGLASFWVLLHHAPNLYPLGTVDWGFASGLVEKGWLGVDLFFVLSGFVLSYVYAAPMARFSWPDSVRFWKLRLARVYPAHLAVLLAFVPVVLLATYRFGYTSPNDAFSAAKFVFALTLTNGWGIPDSAGWNLPSWSVSSEWAAYLAFPWLTIALGRLRALPTNTALILGLIVANTVAGSLLNDNHAFSFPWSFALARIAVEFSIGCLLYNISRGLSAPAARIWDAVSGVALVFVVLFSVVSPAPRWDGVLVALFSVLILGLAHARGPVGRLFGGRLMVYLGEISYAVYLVHALIILLFGQLAQRVWPSEVPTWAPAATLAAYFVASILAGHLLYRWVEQPARSFIRRRWIP